MQENCESLIYGNSAVQHAALFENVILQTLNRRVGKEKLVLKEEFFRKTVDLWEGIPLVKQEQGIHPSIGVIKEHPDTAAAEVGGVIIGAVSNPHIEVTGHPRLMASLQTEDKDVINWWRNGELGISTAFTVNHTGMNGVITSPPIPDHVLLFREVVDRAQQGDPGALVMSEASDMSETPEKTEKPSFRQRIIEKAKSFLADIESEEDLPEPESNVSVANTEEPSITPKEETNMTDTTTPEPSPAEAKPEVKPEAPAAEAAKPEEAAPQTPEKDAEIAKLKAEIAAKDAAIAAKEAELEAKANEEKEQKFSQILNSLPEGMRATEEQRKELRETFDNDPLGFALSVVNSVTSAGTGETRRTGSPYMNSEVSKPQSVGDAGSW